MPNYFNPASFKPELDFRVTGALGGAVAGQDRARYEGLVDIFQRGQEFDLSKKGIEFGEFMQAAPQRALAGQAEMEKNRALIDTARPKAQAELMNLEGIGNQSRLKAKMEEDTYASKLSEAIANSKKEQSDSEWGETINNIREAASLQAVAQQDPSYKPEGVLPISVTSRLRPGTKLADSLLKAGPDSAKLLRIMSQLDPKHIQKMAEEESKEKAAMERQKYSSDKSFEGTKYSADSSAAVARERIKAEGEKEVVIKQLEAKLMRLTTKITEGKASEAEKEDYRVTFEQWKFAKQAAAAANLGFSSNVMGGTGAAAVPQPPSQPRSPDEVSRGGGQPQGGPQVQPDGSVIHGNYKFPNKAAFDRYIAAGGK